MSVETRTVPSVDWNSFVATRSEASLYHRAEWTTLINQVFRQQVWFIEARNQAGELSGILPVVKQRGPIFGSFMTSLPYFNYGGALAVSDPVATKLMDAARQLAQAHRCRYLELRDTVPRAGIWKVRTDKVAMILDLPSSTAVLSATLGAKLRSQSRRPDREGATLHVGGMERLTDFYDVFRRNMHALGTPVYPSRFFRTVMETFPQDCAIVSVRKDGVPQAAGFLIFNRDSVEIPWAACRDEAKPRGYNMKLYWECLSFAIERGCCRFDFGRSTSGSGTYRFKAQWGARPLQLYWHRTPSDLEFDDEHADSNGRLRKLVSRTWKTLPLSLANAIGPLISPRLPW